MNKTLHLLRKAHGLMLIVLTAVLLLVVPSTAMAEKQAYARLADNTLTFYYDENKGQTDTDFSLNSGTDEPEWLAKWPYIFKVVFDESFQDYKPTTCYKWFYKIQDLKSIDGLEYLNTSEVTNMSHMFYGCWYVESLDVTHFDTKNVTDMSYMFFSLNLLTQLDVTGFNTENVTDMAYMFFNSSLTQLNLANFKTDKVTNMSGMFSACDMLTELDLSNFTTSAVTDMSSMFSSCKALTKLNLSNFDTGNVTSMYEMFYSCKLLTELNISGFNTAKVTDMSEMFSGCTSLPNLDVSNFNTDNVEDMCYMFLDCHALTSIDLSGFNTAKVKDMECMLNGCSTLTTLDLSSFNTAAVTSMEEMFNGCTALTTIMVSKNFTTTAVEKSDNMFSGCTLLKGAVAYDASNIDGAYANYTTGYFTKKVGTNGSDILVATGSPLTIETLAIDDAKAYALNEDEDCQAATATYSRPMTSYWGTLCLPFAIDAAAQGNTCNFYSLKSVNAESITLTQIQNGTIEAGTPVVISKKTDGQTVISVTATNATVVAYPITTTSNNSLAGTFAEVLLGDDAYFIAKDKFFNVADYRLVKVNPFRAYIQTGGNANRAAVLNIVTDGSTTGIDATDTIDALNNANTEYYDMNGSRTSGLQKGVNIVKIGNKTRKVIVK